MTIVSDYLFSLKDFELEIEKGKSYLRNIHMDISPGEILFIEGGNGIGKSSLIRNILHQIKNAPHKISWICKSYGYLPQNYENFFHVPMTLQDILKTKCQKNQSSIPLPLNNLNALWNYASGGEKQKTLINFLLSDPCEILFLDEPTNHLDENSKSLLAHSLSRFVKQHNAALVIISHDFKKYFTDHKFKSLCLDPHRVNHV